MSNGKVVVATTCNITTDYDYDNATGSRTLTLSPWSRSSSAYILVMYSLGWEPLHHVNRNKNYRVKVSNATANLKPQLRSNFVAKLATVVKCFCSGVRNSAREKVEAIQDMPSGQKIHIQPVRLFFVRVDRP
jgi:hypothetical protein